MDIRLNFTGNLYNGVKHLNVLCVQKISSIYKQQKHPIKVILHDQDLCNFNNKAVAPTRQKDLRRRKSLS